MSAHIGVPREDCRSRSIPPTSKETHGTHKRFGTSEQTRADTVFGMIGMAVVAALLGLAVYFAVEYLL